MRRVQMGDIRVGSALPWTVYDKNGGLLLRKGYVLSSSGQLDRLIRNGMYVDERERTADQAPLLDRSHVPVFQRVGHLQEQLGRLHNHLVGGRGEGTSRRITELVDAYKKLCREDPDTTLAALHLGDWTYGVCHAAHVAVLADLLAAKKGVGEEERKSLFAAGLTHDIGLLYIQQDLDRQAKLTEDQWAAVRRHPAESVELLKRAGVTDPLWLDIVRHHHERMDGSGYEQGLTGEEIPPLARILSVCDIYSAMIRPRPYREAILAKDALRDIFLSRGRTVDDELAQLFIKELGIFPPGGLVRLTNKEVAVIVRRGEDRTKPVVRSVIGENGMPLSRCIERNTGTAAHAIQEMVSHRECPWVIQNLHVVFA